MTTGRVNPASMGMVLWNILSAPSMTRAKARAPRGPLTLAPASGVAAAASGLPSRPGLARPSPSAARSRRDGSHRERHARGVANHCNQPRSRKADRSTPGGANQPPAPYLAPSFKRNLLVAVGDAKRRARLGFRPTRTERFAIRRGAFGSSTRLPRVRRALSRRYRRCAAPAGPRIRSRAPLRCIPVEKRPAYRGRLRLARECLGAVPSRDCGELLHRRGRWPVRRGPPTPPPCGRSLLPRPAA